jgi:type I restriction enzyme S subunit
MNEKLTKTLQEVVLGEHAHIRARIGWRGLSSKEYIDSGGALLGAGNHISNGRFDWSRCDRITLERYEESPEIALCEKDVVISKDGTIGRVAYIDKLPQMATINGTMMLVRVHSEQLDPHFVYHYLQSEKFQSLIQERVSGSSVPHIFQRDMVGLKMEIPPLPEQKKIAEILSGIDKAINKILEAIAKSETTLTGVFSNLDLIASSGKTATLGEVVRVQNGYAFQSSIFSEDHADIPLVRISNISGGGVDISKSKRIPRGLAPSDEYKVNNGDILIAMSGATTGKIGKYQGHASCLLNQRVGKFVFRPGSDSATYATQLLLSGFLESRILAKAAGGAQPNISGKGIEEIEIPFPDAADQEKHGSAIKELLRVNSIRRILVEKYQHLKASISSDLLSGRKRVSI